MDLNNPEKKKRTADLIDFYKSKPDVVNSKDIDEARINVRKYQANTQFIGKIGKKFKMTANCCFFDGDLVKCMAPGCIGYKSNFQTTNSFCSAFNKHQTTTHGGRRTKKCSQYDFVGFIMDGNKLSIMDIHQIRSHCATVRKEQLAEPPSRLWIKETLKRWCDTVPELSHDDEKIRICANAAVFEAEFQSTNESESWEKCFLVKDSKGLGMKCPGAAEILKMLKEEEGTEERQYIDVYKGEKHWTTQEKLVEMFDKTKRDRTTVFNNLDCNVSYIPAFMRAIRIPKFASDQSMVRSLKLENVSEFDRYVVMSQAKAFTDFHVDFGGTSVYFHMLKGKKTFFLVEPTEENIKKHEEYEKSDGNEWFGSMDGIIVKKVTMTAGNTFFMPGGWIHAVYTHEDSVAISGNFFHAGCISRQLRAFRVEVNVQPESEYRVPEFIPIHFAYMTQKLLKDVEDSNKKRRNMPTNSRRFRSIWERFQEIFEFLNEFKEGAVTEEALAPSQTAFKKQLQIQGKTN
ncbi:hypothetical protein CAEBREN_00111 [Caenorhabditis brenneri]|uniref:JmjC domain-containing protein n=1 Tax=Caenorhabditis brenneri TaxID=135651 RepID=G0MMR2_CAEBE|nr:hypothetical protein CAEBREN_00111 [Caenorhabditis brenneri]